MQVCIHQGRATPGYWRTDGSEKTRQVLALQLKSSAVRVVFSAHLSAEDGIPPGAIFRDENRELTVQDCTASAVPIRRNFG